MKYQNIYSTGRYGTGRKRKGKAMNMTYSGRLEGYDPNRKKKCKKCKKFILMIKNKPYETQPDKTGCHPPHVCSTD